MLSQARGLDPKSDQCDDGQVTPRFKKILNFKILYCKRIAIKYLRFCVIFIMYRVVKSKAVIMHTVMLVRLAGISR